MYARRLLRLIVCIFPLVVGAYWWGNVRDGRPELPTFPGPGECNVACVNGLAQGIASDFGPDTALAWVRAIDVPDVQYSCHALEHTIGRSAAEQKWPDFPPLISLECQYGYLHGVLQFRATKSTLDEWINTTHTYCVSLEDKPKAECLHGLGHGAAVSTPNDLAQVLLACSKIEGDASDPCADGAMMEFADDIW